MLQWSGMGKKSSTHQNSSTDRHVALLRGINVGGKNKLAMKDLAAIFVEAGCADVATYIQSGNVVFTAVPRVAKAVPEIVAGLIESRFGIRSPIITRSAAEMSAVLDKQPFSEADDKALHVAFLADRPTSAAAKSLVPDRSPGDSFQLIGREVYLHLPNGVARTKLTNAWFDSTLNTVSTVRNWRTVNALVEMLGA